jgi:hypothetical protein
MLQVPKQNPLLNLKVAYLRVFQLLLCLHQFQPMPVPILHKPTGVTQYKISRTQAHSQNDDHCQKNQNRLHDTVLPAHSHAGSHLGVTSFSFS